MLYEYMGKGTNIYGKCVNKYMGGVPLGSDTRSNQGLLNWNVIQQTLA